MFITVDGFKMGLDTSNAAEAVDLALSLQLAGYSVKINGLHVTVFYGPGYDSLLWGEGDYAGQNILETLH